MQFSLLKKDKYSKARAGVIITDSGLVQTPMFMPVGTVGTVKSLTPEQLELNVKAQIILANTYHLYLRPGTDIIIKSGGIHNFMNWGKNILTDSGGFQIYSLSELRKLKENGVEFRSHIDGSYHFFTPEKVIKLQREIGSDIMMPLDECTPYPCEYEYAKNSVILTSKWAIKNKEEFENSFPLYDKKQALFGIVQGSIYKKLREKSAADLINIDFEGYSIGGLAVGEPQETLNEIVDFTTDMLPYEKPRYLMGVGRPENILDAIERGVDMFDCVMPTRNARNAYLFSYNGIVTIKNSVYKDDPRQIDSNCQCYTCNNFSRSYIRHLFNTNEILANTLATIHNLFFYIDLVKNARKQILEGNFVNWKNKIYNKLSNNIKNISEE